jgi:hypothetical protein
VRDDQVRRYARHILLDEVGGLGQTALLVSTARLELRESEPRAELIAGAYLAAGGVGTLVVTGATEAQRAALATPDTRVLTEGAGEAVVLSPRPPWWPSAAGDDEALAFWRGSLAATRYMAAIIDRR